MFGTWLTDAGAAAGALLAVIGLVIALGRLRPVRWVWRRLVSEPMAAWFRTQVRDEVALSVQPIYERLHSIDEQLKPNGGNSLRDRVDYVEGRVDQIADDAGIQ